MWQYEKKLEYPINIKRPDPRMAKLIVSQYGGPDGELGASLRYLSYSSIGIIYFFVNPELSIWMPKCPWWLLTDTYCPACGLQRFLHSLLRGNIIDAFLINPFLLISLPYAVLAVLGKWYNVNGIFNKLNRFIYKRNVLIAYIVLYFVWWAIRIIFNI